MVSLACAGLVGARSAVSGGVRPRSVRYKVTVLEGIPTAINNQGQIAGTEGSQGYIWTDANHNAVVDPGERLLVSAPPGAAVSFYAINESGQAAGDGAAFGVYQAGIFSDGNHNGVQDPGEGFQIPTLGGQFGRAYGINNASEAHPLQAAGFADTGKPETHAFRWSDDNRDGQAQQQEVIDLGTFGGIYAAAYGINDLGQVVGASTDAERSLHAFIWQNGAMTKLSEGTFGGEARAINNRGQIVGFGFDVAGRGGAALWEPQGNGTWQLQLLGTPNDAASVASGLNGVDQVVGILARAAHDHAFLWQKDGSGQGVITDLNTVIPAEAHVEMRAAFGINDAGQIVGDGYVNGSTSLKGIVLTPITGDTAAPVVNLTSPDEGFASRTHLLPVRADVTDDSDVTWNVLVDGVSQQTGTTKGVNGLSVDLNLADGSHTIEVRVQDSAGNTAPAIVRHVTVDTGGPTVTLTAPKSNSTHNGGTLHVAGRVSDSAALARWDVLIDGVVVGGQPVTGQSAAVSADVPQPRNGKHTLTLRATDSSGNAGEKSLTFTEKGLPGKLSSFLVTLTLPPVVEPNPAKVRFGPVKIGVNARKYLVLQNSGGNKLTFTLGLSTPSPMSAKSVQTSVAQQVANALQLAMTVDALAVSQGNKTVSLAPGHAVVVELGFKPKATVQSKGSVRLTPSGKPTTTLFLAGTGVR